MIKGDDRGTTRSDLLKNAHTLQDQLAQKISASNLPDKNALLTKLYTPENVPDHIANNLDSVAEKKEEKAEVKAESPRGSLQPPKHNVSRPPEQQRTPPSFQSLAPAGPPPDPIALGKAVETQYAALSAALELAKSTPANTGELVSDFDAHQDAARSKRPALEKAIREATTVHTKAAGNNIPGAAELKTLITEATNYARTLPRHWG